MQYQEYNLLQVGLVQKLIIVVILLSLLVSAEKEAETVVVGMNNRHHPPTTTTQMPDKQNLKQQRLRHSFDEFFSSKRRVPNASDPLHNR